MTAFSLLLVTLQPMCKEVVNQKSKVHTFRVKYQPFIFLWKHEPSMFLGRIKTSRKLTH